MDPTDVVSSYTATAAASSTTTLVSDPCVLKSIRYASTNTTSSVTVIDLLDGSTSLGNLLVGSLPDQDTTGISWEFPGLGIRFLDSVVINPDIELGNITCVYQF